MTTETIVTILVSLHFIIVAFLIGATIAQPTFNLYSEGDTSAGRFGTTLIAIAFGLVPVVNLVGLVLCIQGLKEEAKKVRGSGSLNELAQLIMKNKDYTHYNSSTLYNAKMGMRISTSHIQHDGHEYALSKATKKMLLHILTNEDKFSATLAVYKESLNKKQA